MDELLKLMLSQLPNVLGLLLAALMLREVLLKMLALLEQCLKDNDK